MSNPRLKVAWLAPFPINTLSKAIFSKTKPKLGTGTWLKNLADEIAKFNNVELHIICELGNIPFSHSFIEDKINYHLIKNTLPFTKKGFPYFFPIQELGCYRYNSFRMKKILDSIKPDIVHAQGTENSYALSAIRSKYPHVISIQGLLKEINKYNQPSLRSRLKTWLEAEAIKKGHHFICRTNLDSFFVESLNPMAKIHIVYEAINPVFYKNNWNVIDELSLLFVGSLQERKGIFILLKAMKLIKEMYQNVCLYIIGNGKKQYVNALKEYCNNNDLNNNINFLGYQTSEVIAKYHLKSQIFVCPSFIENSPNCIAEAMVSGLPIIASNVGGIPSMIIDGHTGYLVRSNDPNELANKIVYLLSNPSERIRLSNNGKQIAIYRHSPKSVADNTMAVYNAILSD
jgi:glycosyltransferase involved in cell wall biosynthesis